MMFHRTILQTTEPEHRGFPQEMGRTGIFQQRKHVRQDHCSPI